MLLGLVPQETLAMLLALQHFEVYIGSSPTPVVVYTDNNPLVFLSQMYNRNQRLMQWAPGSRLQHHSQAQGGG